MFTDPAASADPDLPNLEVLYVNLRGCDDGYPSEDMDEYCKHQSAHRSRTLIVIKLLECLIPRSHCFDAWVMSYKRACVLHSCYSVYFVFFFCTSSAFCPFCVKCILPKYEPQLILNLMGTTET